jgi:hypothetical protein
MPRQFRPVYNPARGGVFPQRRGRRCGAANAMVGAQASAWGMKQDKILHCAFPLFFIFTLC